MEPLVGMLGVAGIASVGAFGLAFRQRRRRLGLERRPRSAADRLEALAAAQAELGLRLDALAEAAPEEKLQAMAGQLLGLIRDKNATFETALAGLDQLRARMRALEQMGEPAEARALVEALGDRLDALQAAEAARGAALEARIQALEAPEGGVSELAERLAKLHAAKDAGIEAALQRLQPLEARLIGVEGELGGLRPAREAARRLETKLEALAAEQGAVRTELAALKAEAAAPRALAEELAKLHAQRDALAEVIGRLAALEDGGPFAEVSEQLTRLYGQKDAAVEAVLGRLAPLEAKLAEIEQGLAARDPRAALDRVAERLEAVQGRVGALESAENPFAEISEQLTRLYGQKDAAVEAVLGRLAPLEAKLAEIEQGLAARDPQAALDRFAERLEAAKAGLQGQIDALRDGSPFAEVSEQLTRLYGQKDAAVEAMLGRLAPLEAKLAEVEGGVARLAPLGDDRAVEGLRARVEALHWAQGETAAGLAAIRAAGDVGGIADRLARLLDPLPEQRLAPLEARLADLEAQPWDDVARAEAEAVAAELAAVRAAPGEAALLADRLTLLEASLPGPGAAAGPEPAPAAGIEAILTLPRVVSLHQK